MNTSVSNACASVTSLVIWMKIINQQYLLGKFEYPRVLTGIIEFRYLIESKTALWSVVRPFGRLKLELIFRTSRQELKRFPEVRLKRLNFRKCTQKFAARRIWIESAVSPRQYAIHASFATSKPIKKILHIAQRQ
jgi:hypothetical protein